ncbi:MULTISPECIES: YVTN family beta-propeller repeat-containing protein [unclassified Bacillus (in: firmicutes)]|uniref:YVTN family beta-propeller repeat-containing protein n=1 Tax=unclassified Bacillus (in: firmicutes) TaxID=185979 RepID=UPI0008EB2060|nr:MULTISPECIES: YVTN family beta-propeller repeat-containing protein [unclassified Bacillus (in: firmicutes)]SFI92489.1 40-residue YVTN family beta-propeller repeat-containing protein [Bacillus sp. 71mf]SFS65761.1 40-residue YVTN family beta-propeller repeat-containing protein [Bacillus sp. 103mf]
MKRWLISLCIVLLLTGCKGGAYQSIDTKTSLLITTNIKEGSISFIDTDTKKTITTWHLNETITGTTLLPDRNRLLVYGKQLEYIYVYSLKDGKQLEKWNTGKGIANILLSENGKELFVADQNQQKIRVFTTNGKETESISVGKGPLTIVQHNDMLYVLNFYDTKLSSIDVKQKKVVNSFMIPPASTGAFLSRDGKDIFIGGHGDGKQVNEKVLMYSVQDGQMLQSLHAPFMPVSLSTDQQFIYVLSHGSNTLRKFDGKTYKEVGALEVGSNPFAFWQIGNEGYVASYDSDEVYVLDLSEMKIKQTISVGKGPFQFTQRVGEKK